MLLHFLNECYLNLFLSLAHFCRRISKQNLELKRNGAGVPIIVISGHGGGATRSDFLYLIKKLKRPGIVVDFGLQTGYVDIYSKKLDIYAKDKRVVLIGISMGGIIAARYIQKHGWKNINQLITVCAPFQGVNVPKLLNFLNSVQDLRSGSAFMKEVKLFKAPKNKMVCIYGKWDQYMKPESATVNGAKNIQLDTYGHLTTEIKSVNTIYNLLK